MDSDDCCGRPLRCTALAQVVLLLCAVTFLGNVTAATVNLLLDYYVQRPPGQGDPFLLFKLNLLNFMSWMMFVLFGWLVPICRRTFSRFSILVSMSVLTLTGLILQGLFSIGYSLLFASAVLLSIPEPFLLSNILIWIQNSITVSYRNQALSLTLILVYGAGGAGYMTGLFLMPTLESLVENWFPTMLYLSIAVFVGSFLWLFLYGLTCWDTASLPLQEAMNDEMVIHPGTQDSVGVLAPSARSDRGTFSTVGESRSSLCRFGVYLVSCSIMSATGVIVPAILAQLYGGFQATNEDMIVGAVVYGIVPTLVCYPIGLVLDRYPPDHWLFWVPFTAVIAQTIGLFGMFYFANSSTALAVYLVLFGLGNTPSMIIFLPAITKLSSKPKSELNQIILWCSALLISLSVFVLLIRPSIEMFGPILCGLSMASLVGLVLQNLCVARS